MWRNGCGFLLYLEWLEKASLIMSREEHKRTSHAMFQQDCSSQKEQICKGPKVEVLSMSEEHHGVCKRQSDRRWDQRGGSGLGQGVMWVPGGHCRAFAFYSEWGGNPCGVMSGEVRQSGLRIGLIGCIQDWLHNLQDTVLNETAWLCVKKLLNISRWWQLIIKLSFGSFWVWGPVLLHLLHSHDAGPGYAEYRPLGMKSKRQWDL